MGENLVDDRLAGDQLNLTDAGDHDVNALERLDINDSGCARRKLDLKGKRRDAENAAPSFRPINLLTDGACCPAGLSAKSTVVVNFHLH